MGDQDSQGEIQATHQQKANLTSLSGNYKLLRDALPRYWEVGTCNRGGGSGHSSLY